MWSFSVANLEGQSSLLGQDFIVSQGSTLNFKTLVWNTKAGNIRLFKKGSNLVWLELRTRVNSRWKRKLL